MIVVSNECLGLPFMAQQTVTEIKDEVAATFMAVVELTATNAKVNTLANMSVSTAEVASTSGSSERQARRNLNILSSSGLLARKGARGGWMLNVAMAS